jgi:hypothetical protein
MKCARPNCPCTVDAGKGVDVAGKTYCCRTCAEVCTDEKCVCTPCDCPK